MLGRWLVALVCVLTLGGTAWSEDAPTVQVETGHPWKPPFGLGRIGLPLSVRVEFAEGSKPLGRIALVFLLEGEEVERRPVELPAAPPYRVRTPLDVRADAVAIDVTGEGEAAAVRVVMRPISGLQADAIAVRETPINPVNLGTVFVPEGWLLLGPGDRGRVDVAVVSRLREMPAACVRVWYDSAPGGERVSVFDVPLGRRVDVALPLPSSPPTIDRDTLHVEVDDAEGIAVWRKSIPVMLVLDPPRLPAFGATRLKLRFDAPISVRDPGEGTFSTLDYERGWSADLDDVVVSLPNGGRFVFWRGSSYIPFWAGERNTGLCYEWAENLARPADAVDCVEPLMDKELRYGRVGVVESTAARVHVRWRYQSTDLHYKIWGDEAVEDYYFYPDGFGTRVVSLKHDPESDYELSEMILLAAQDAYPFAVVPERPIRVLGADGSSRAIALPVDREAEAALRRDVMLPAIYRVRMHREDKQSAIYFNPRDQELPPIIFGPFADGGEVVTPAYWGSHWPLARGNATGSAIDERIHVTPSHNSLMSWAKSKPEPIESALVETLDALGRSRRMVVRRWAWLIGMTDASDERVRDFAESYARPPSVTARGARLRFEGYALERRAICLVVEAAEVEIDIDPGGVPVVNPVFELMDAPKGPLEVVLDGRSLAADRFAWDGRVLWIDATLDAVAHLELHFGLTSRPD